MPDFSIKIVPVGNGLAGFQPDLPGSNPGDPLNAPPSSIVSWSNHTSDIHQVALDDGSYTSNEILPELTSKTDYVAPSQTGTLSYHCTKHKGEIGKIIIQAVVPMPPLALLFIVLWLSGWLAVPAHAQKTPGNGQGQGQGQGQKTPGAGQNQPPSTSQIPCLPPQQPLVRIPEIVSKDGRLRATLIAGTEQVRMPMRYPLTFVVDPSTGKTQASQPGDPQTFQACFPEWVRTFRSPDTTTPFPPPTNGLADPMLGPTLRARVGDFIELTFLNEIDPSKFGQSIDSGDKNACESTSAGYPLNDNFPNCFHGSTTANFHFHGTHTNPNSTGDNVFLQVLSSKRLIGNPPPPPPPNFDEFFTKCEAELSKGSHVEWPVTWKDLPEDYTKMQKDLLQRFDGQPEIGNKLWPVNQAALDRQDWPQYYIGSFPYCFRLPTFPEEVPTPPLKGGAGMREMEAHQGIETLSVTEQGGPLKMGQSPGTHWYHAHKHGSTTIDVSNGFAGAFIIEGQYDDEINEVYKAYGPQWTRTQPVLVIDQFGTSPNLKGGAGQDKGPDFSLNGRTNPIINMKPGEVQMWRILNASSRAGVLFLAPQGVNWKTLAIDGVQLYTDNYANSSNKGFILAGGNRIDLLVQAKPCTTPSGCTYPLQVHNTVDPSDLVPNPPNRGPFNITLATIKVSGGAPVNMPFPATSPAKTFPTDLNDITDSEVRGTQIIDFATVTQNFGGKPPTAAVHSINGKQFNGEVGVAVLLNNVEEWTITNSIPAGKTFPLISHPFHIHINPFQVTEVFAPNSTLADGKTPMYHLTTDKTPVKPGQCILNPDNPATWKPCRATVPVTHRIWWDVFPIPSGMPAKKSDGTPITIKGYFKMRSRFVDYPGWYVIHCHILAHEDRGMMTVVEVTPIVSPYSHH
jgi:FtsP/CotA-like multicopper oxidase with cupredoxin domain/plastocyanin